MARALSLAAFVLTFCFASQVYAGCGPSQCYTGCTDGRPEVDIVFAVDTSASMDGSIAGVKSGMITFINNIQNAQYGALNAMYAVVTFATPNVDPTLQQGFTSNSAPIINIFNGFNSYTLQGWRETGLETMRCIAQACNTDNMNLNFRSGSQRVLILMTDEDSDPPNHQANMNWDGVLFETQTQVNTWCAPSSVDPRPLPYTDNSGYYYCPTQRITDWTNWQNEITVTAQVYASQNWFVYILNNNFDHTCQTCLNFFQYGDPNAASQNTDFSNFNPTQTLANLRSTSYDGGRGGNSFQANMLAAGKNCRTFNVHQAGDSTFINNFFATIQADLNVCNHNCYDYPCAGNPLTCQTPVYMCDCAGSRTMTSSKDVNGVCCLTTDIDCAGVCNGGHSYDSCGVCTAGGVNNVDCVKDTCTNNWYQKAPPPAGVIILPVTTFPPNNEAFDPAGYVLSNSDLYAAAVADHWGVTQAENHFQTNGRYEGRLSCTFDTSYFGGSDASFFVNMPSSPSSKMRCLAGSLVKYYPTELDNCDQCVLNLNSPPSCVKDCRGDWVGVGGTVYVTDLCGDCGTNPADTCSSCADPCQNCPGSSSYVLGNDKCGQPLCLHDPCHTQCDGTTYTISPTKGLDHCNDCVSLVNGTAPDASTCKQQCDGTWYNPSGPSPQPTAMHTDECGNCIPTSEPRATSCKQDCNGNWGGNATVNNCGSCVGGLAPPEPACLKDCNGTYYNATNTPVHVVNPCNVCVLNNPVAINSTYDHCGRCTNAPGYDASLCQQDCHNDWYLVGSPHSLLDACGDCWYPNQMSHFNQNQDPCGVCYVNGSANPKWYSEAPIDPTYGFRCLCYSKPEACPSLGNNMTCGDCPPMPCAKTDQCGRCPGTANYGLVDQCGQCCSDPANCANQNNVCVCGKDVCGTCGGTMTAALLKQQPCGLCPGVKYGCDCVANSTKTYDCTGQCGGNCCACDSSGKCTRACSGTTQNYSTSNAGTIAGSVVGAVAGVAALALAGFFAVSYAKKHGLLGFEKASDMTSANVNPMYQNQTHIASNPLYNNV